MAAPHLTLVVDSEMFASQLAKDFVGLINSLL